MIIQLNDEQIIIVLWIIRPGIPIPFNFLEVLYSKSKLPDLLLSRGLFWKHLDVKYIEKLGKTFRSIFRQHLKEITINVKDEENLKEIVDIFFGGYPEAVIEVLYRSLQQCLC